MPWSLALAVVSLLGLFAGKGPRVSRPQVVALARAELGSTDRARYLTAELGFDSPGLSWCGIWALWVLHQCGLAIGIRWVPGMGFLFLLPHYPPHGKRVPLPGDIAYFEAYQHHAIVEAYHPEDDTVSLLNGNGAGGAVTRTRRPRSDALAYYDIDPFLRAAA